MSHLSGWQCLQHLKGGSPAIHFRWTAFWSLPWLLDKNGVCHLLFIIGGLWVVDRRGLASDWIDLGFQCEAVPVQTPADLDNMSCKW